MTWDPEIDSPATIAVIGGGLTGIEAALYARFLGYDVFLADRRRLGGSPSDSSTAAWADGCSSPGLAALEAQETPLVVDNPQPESHLEFVDRYLRPLARTDLLRDSIMVQCQAISICRVGCSDPSIPIQTRAECEFRVLLNSKQRGEFSQLADIVLDCSGRTAPSGLATGGGLAIGESSLRDQIPFAKHIVADEKSIEEINGKSVTLWGQSTDAIRLVDRLAGLSPTTKIQWLLPKKIGASGGSQRPMVEQVIARHEQQVIPIEAWGIERLELTPDHQWKLQLQTTRDETLAVYAESFVDGSQLVQDSSFLHGLSLDGCPDQMQLSPCMTGEPHYYLLGSTICEDGDINASKIRQQIQDLFGIIGGRRDLNLYETVQPQVTPDQ